MDKYTNANPLTVRPSSHAKWIEGARDGNVIAAQALMSDAATCLQHGMPLPELLANYIGKALYSSSLKPDDISQAFNLEERRVGNSVSAV